MYLLGHVVLEIAEVNGVVAEVAGVYRPLNHLAVDITNCYSGSGYFRRRLRP